MNTLVNKLTGRLFSKWMLLNMLNWLSRQEDDLGPIFALWTENPDKARPVILRFMIRHPITGVRAIIDSIRYHYC